MRGTALFTLGFLCALASPAAAQKAMFDPPTLTRNQPRQLTLTWEPYGGVVKYRILRRLGSKGEWKPLKEVEGTSYTDTALLPGSVAFYKLEAVGVQAESRESERGEALADLYLEVVNAEGSSASLFIYQWRAAQDGWTKSLRTTAQVGKTITGEDVVGTFDTKYRVLKIGREPPGKGEDPRGFIKVLTAERRIAQFWEGVKPPNEVWQKKEKKPKATKEEPKKPVASKPRPTPKPKKPRKPIRFPEPKLIGPLKSGKKHVEWEIVNASRFVMDFVIVAKKGKPSYKFKVPADTTMVIKVKRGGDYEVTINAIANEVVPLKSEFGLLEGHRYQSKFGVKTLDPSDPRSKKKRGP